MSGRDGSAVVRVAVRGPSWCRIYSVRQGGVVVSRSFSKATAAAVLNNQFFDRANGVNQ